MQLSINRCLGIFNALGKKVFYCGPNGNGAVVKLVNNLIGGVLAVACSEGLGGKDFSVIVKVFEDLLNVKLKY